MLNLFQYILKVWYFLLSPIRRTIFLVGITLTSTNISHFNWISYYKLFSTKYQAKMSQNIYKPFLHKNHANIYEFASFIFKPQNVVIQEDTNLPILLTNDRPEGWRHLRDYQKSDWIKYKQSLKQQSSPNKREDANQKNRKDKSFKFQKQQDKQKYKPIKGIRQAQKEKRIFQGSEAENYLFINKRIPSQERQKQQLQQKQYEISQILPQMQRSQNLKSISEQIEVIKGLLLKKDVSKKESCQDCASRRNRKQDLLDKLQLQQSKSMKLLQENVFLKETVRQLISNKDYLQLYIKQLNQNSSSKYFTLIMEELKGLKKSKEEKINNPSTFSGQQSFRQIIQEDTFRNQRFVKKVEELEEKNIDLISQINYLKQMLDNKDKISSKQQQQIKTLQSSIRNVQDQGQKQTQIKGNPIFYSRMTVNKDISQFIKKQVHSFTKRRISNAILLYQKDKFNTNIFNYFDRLPFPVLILFQTLNDVIFGAFAEGTQTYRRNLEEQIQIKHRVFLFNASQQIAIYENEKNVKSIGLSFKQNYLRFGNNEMCLKNNNLDKIIIAGNSIFGQKYFKMLNCKSLTGQAGEIVEIKGLQIHQLQFQSQ